MENDGLWPYPQIDAVATAAVVVDRDGRRILDEGLGGISITNDLARLDDPLCGTVICDAPIWRPPARRRKSRPTRSCSPAAARCTAPKRWRSWPKLPLCRSTALIETIAAYNDAIRDNRLATLSPKRSTRSGQPRRIETPPFFAIPICAGITNTMGGIAIDGHGRVKRPDGSTIAGLYAAGGATGGLEGGGALRLCRRIDQGLCLRAAGGRARGAPAIVAGQAIR